MSLPFNTTWWTLVTDMTIAALRAVTFVASIFYLLNFIPLGIYAIRRVTQGRRVPISALMAVGICLVPLGVMIFTAPKTIGVLFGFESWDAGGRMLGYLFIFTGFWIQGFARAKANGTPKVALWSLVAFGCIACMYALLTFYMAYTIPNPNFLR